jgi:hypothetical protein
MGMTQDQMNAIGILVDSIPDPTPGAGQASVMYVDPTTKIVSYEYVTATPTIEDRLAALESFATGMLGI